MLASAPPGLDRKRYGIYYTPPQLAQTLAEWAIRGPNDTVLEPSFGGCNFLKASHDRLIALGCNDALRQICGTDVDKHALDSLAEAFGLIDVQRRFLLKDFLSTEPTDFCVQQFDAIVGNPPYVSHHAVSADQKAIAWQRATDSGWKLRRTASLWAYFVLHSLKFCKVGGRVAFVLPPAVVLADYSLAVRAIFEAAFESVEFRDVCDRLFQDQGTNERSILLLATGFRGAAYTSAKTASRASQLERRFFTTSRIGSVDDEAARFFETIALQSVALGDRAILRIGSVTGANKLFVVSAETAEEHAFNDDVLLPVLAKIPSTHGLAYTDDDHLQAVTAGDRCYLIRPAARSLHRQPLCIRRYFTTVSDEDIEANRTFGKRKRWFVVDDVREPDAFLSYMHHASPTLILNTIGAVCTNNIHRVWWKDGVAARHQRLASISLLCTFTKLSAEFEGRTYGGGVLKHELGEARKIRLLLPDSLTDSAVDSAYAEIDQLLREGERTRATARADEILLGAVMKRRDVILARARLTRALNVARDHRVAR
jgi:hypothetical protein